MSVIGSNTLLTFLFFDDDEAMKVSEPSLLLKVDFDTSVSPVLRQMRSLNELAVPC